MAWVSEMLRSVLDNDKKALRVEIVGGGNGGGNMEDFYKKEEVDSKLDKKVDNSRVLKNVPADADFTNTKTIINDKTGVISKTDIVALGIPAQDTVYVHPKTHEASMIAGLHPISITGKSSELDNDAGFIDGTYDNESSGLTATTIGGSVDELKALIDALVARIEALESAE